MITIKNKTWFATLLTACISLATFQAQAISVYQWTTDGPEGDDKWNTRGTPDSERNDGSGGHPWDINFLGVGISGGQFHVRAEGGSILSGSNMYGNEQLTLSDIAINIFDPAGNPSESDNPSHSSSGWDYALDLVTTSAGVAYFDLYALFDPDGVEDDGYWRGSGKHATTVVDGETTYQHQNYSWGSTQTFEMVGGHKLNQDGYIQGQYSSPADGDDVLEVSFDLGLLSLFDEHTGGRIITYLTMSCANDEAIVDAHVSPVPLPSAVWLFGSALLGFIGMSRRTRV